jgi:hypothetical protein
LPSLASPVALALREPYGTPENQRQTSTLGMWIFLATEVMFFGGLFAGFAVYRMYYTQGFNEGSAEMEILLGAVNTAVLITSSLMMALSVYSITVGKELRTSCWQLLFWAWYSLPSSSLSTTCITSTTMCLGFGSIEWGRTQERESCFLSTTSA